MCKNLISALQLTWIQIIVLYPTIYLTLGKSFNLSEFAALQIKDNYAIYLSWRVIWRVNTVMYKDPL